MTVNTPRGRHSDTLAGDLTDLCFDATQQFGANLVPTRVRALWRMGRQTSGYRSRCVYRSSVPWIPLGSAASRRGAG